MIGAETFDLFFSRVLGSAPMRRSPRLVIVVCAVVPTLPYTLALSSDEQSNGRNIDKYRSSVGIEDLDSFAAAVVVPVHGVEANAVGRATT